MIDDLETILLGGPKEKPSSWSWATVTQASPLRVRLDGDAAALLVTPEVLQAGLTFTVGQRVWVQLNNRRVVVHAATTEAHVPGTATFDQLDSSALPSDYSAGIRVGNTGNDSGWPETYASVYVFHANNGARVVQMVVKSAASATAPTTINVRSSSSSNAWGPWQLIGGGDPNGDWADITTFGSGYSSQSSTYTIQYVRDGNWVHLRGLLAKSTNWAASTTYASVITIPNHFRIDETDMFVAATSVAGSVPGTWVIYPTGLVDLRTKSTQETGGYFSFANVHFKSTPS